MSRPLSIIMAGLMGLAIHAALPLTAYAQSPVVTAQQGDCDGAGASPFGFMGPDHDVVPLEKRLDLYRSLGAHWMRVHSSVPVTKGKRVTDVEDIPAFRAAGFATFLSLGDPALRQSGVGQPLDAYEAALRDTLQHYRPTMFSVENEVDNYPTAMSAADYLAKSTVACRVAHGLGIQCTDSGMTTKMLIALLVDWELEKGDNAVAQRYAGYLGLWYGDKPVPAASPEILKTFLVGKGVPRARTILQGLRTAGFDRVNMHWYLRLNPTATENDQDSNLLPPIISMLRARSGLPITAGEVGFDTAAVTDAGLKAEQVHGLATSLVNAGAQPIILWNPGAGLFKNNLHALSLVDGKGDALPAAQGLVEAVHEQAIHSGCPGTNAR